MPFVTDGIPDRHTEFAKNYIIDDVLPFDWHPIADSLSDEQLKGKLANTKKLAVDPLSQIPSHDEFLKMFGKKV